MGRGGDRGDRGVPVHAARAQIVDVELREQRSLQRLSESLRSLQSGGRQARERDCRSENLLELRGLQSEHVPRNDWAQDIHLLVLRHRPCAANRARNELHWPAPAGYRIRSGGGHLFASERSRRSRRAARPTAMACKAACAAGRARLGRARPPLSILHSLHRVRERWGCRLSARPTSALPNRLLASTSDLLATGCR